jgi:primary-amine oxidase
MRRDPVTGTALALALLAGAAAHAGPHPLDPLSAEEITATVEALRKAGHVTDATRFPSIGLLEPAKAEVAAWRPGTSTARRAEAVVRQGTAVHEAVVDLGTGTVERYVAVPGAQSSILLEEWGAAQAAATGDARFTAALAARGVTDPTKVFCAPFSMGYFAIPEHEGKRLLKVGCFDISRTETNMFGWPIEGLYAVVDLGAGTVIEIHDSGPVPLSPSDLNFSEKAIGALRAPLKPVTIEKPAGPNLEITGHTIAWQKWRLHARLDRRVGLVLSTVAYDGRPVLYQGYLSEMFVPYMDPDYGWYSRTYFDTGEYGAGMLSSALVAGVDCPASAAFLPAVINDDAGKPVTMPNVVCVFERNTGDPVWRHAELLNQTYEGRPDVELVVRFVPTIGNYDYLVDWVLDTAGEIEVRLGATGIDALKGVATASMADPTAARDTATGMLVAANLVAVNHDHFFSFRLDLDVDGPANTLVRDVYRPEASDGPRKSLYRVTTEPVTEEGGFELGHSVAKWRVVSTTRTNAVGNPTSYELMHHAHTPLLLDPADWAARRGAFASRQLWLTVHDPAERYAGGTYVFGARGEDGLPAWTAEPAPAAGQDLVLWVTVGMNHLPRAEDLPVMPTLWHSFRLRPFNFHDRNPAIDVPARFAQQ